MATNMTPAELAAFRLNKGKSTVDLLKEAKAKDIQKKMDESKAPLAVDVGTLPPQTSMSDESKKMIEDTNKGYEYTKKRDYAKGGSVGSASKRADGCAVGGKTIGMMR